MSGPEHDLFLSYSSADRAAVLGIRSQLEALGVDTFLDRSNLSPGQPWPLELEQALRRAPAEPIRASRHVRECLGVVGGLDR